ERPTLSNSCRPCALSVRGSRKKACCEHAAVRLVRRNEHVLRPAVPLDTVPVPDFDPLTSKFRSRRPPAGLVPGQSQYQRVSTYPPPYFSIFFRHCADLYRPRADYYGSSCCKP